METDIFKEDAMKRNRKSGLRKERIIMLAASVFILTALTMTGVYVNQKNTQEQDQYRIDLNEIERNTDTTYPPNVASDDLDVEINFEEANTSDVVLPVEDQTQLHQPVSEDVNPVEEIVDNPVPTSDENAVANDANTTTFVSQEPERVPHFSESEVLQWPIVGNILINYSMDKAVYFETLNQYRYNPSIVIGATVGEVITAAADGKITSIRNNVETGGTVVCDLGDGYELTYGQLENLQVGVGDYVEAGDVIGYVAEPSIFYSEEGSNVYFQLTLNGEPINPLDNMEE